MTRFKSIHNPNRSLNRNIRHIFVVLRNGSKQFSTMHALILCRTFFFFCRLITVAKVPNQQGAFDYHIGIYNKVEAPSSARDGVAQIFPGFTGDQLHISFHRRWDQVFVCGSDFIAWGRDKELARFVSPKLEGERSPNTNS